MSSLVKQRYIDLLNSGVFSRFNPAQLDALHTELKQFINAGVDTLDSVQLFDILELQFYVLLLTNHDVEAKSCLDRFNDQFGDKKSQKLMVLRLMYYEAVGDMKAAVDALGSDPDELLASKRLATFSRTNSDGTPNPVEYIKSLNYYLALQPSDATAWAELGDVYSSVGHYDKAVFCFKEVLLHVPDAHNMFYKAGLNLYYQHLHLNGLKADKKEAILENLSVFEHARDCLLKCVELNAGYTKAWLGVYLLSQSPLLAQIKGKSALLGLKRVEQVTDEMERLGKLSQKRVMELEKIDDEEKYEAFLKN